MVDLLHRDDGYVEEIPPAECPNGDPWPRGAFTVLWSGARGWRCNTCQAEIWDEPPLDFGQYPAPPSLS